MSEDDLPAMIELYRSGKYLLGSKAGLVRASTGDIACTTSYGQLLGTDPHDIARRHLQQYNAAHQGAEADEYRIQGREECRMAEEARSVQLAQSESMRSLERNRVLELPRHLRPHLPAAVRLFRNGARLYGRDAECLPHMRGASVTELEQWARHVFNVHNEYHPDDSADDFCVLFMDDAAYETYDPSEIPFD